jgi:hypothetical protein
MRCTLHGPAQRARPWFPVTAVLEARLGRITIADVAGLKIVVPGL